MNRSIEGSLVTDVIIETFKLGGALVTEGDRMCAPLGLTSARWKVLGALMYSDQPLTVSQIARNMGLTRQAVQTLVNGLCDTGLIELLENPDHKRAKLAELTSEGKSVYQQMESIQIPWANQLGSLVSQDDLEATLRTLRTLSSAL